MQYDLYLQIYTAADISLLSTNVTLDTKVTLDNFSMAEIISWFKEFLDVFCFCFVLLFCLVMLSIIGLFHYKIMFMDITSVV